MLTKERTSKTRKLKYAAVALALLAVLVFCFASCGKATPTGIEYVENTASKLVYNLGETFDCTGAQVKVTYANGAEETVAVTPEMVGTAPLTFGMESVTVTYSENGATVVGHIPVTVVDPNAALKADTITKLAEGEKVVARKNDGGVALLLKDCSAKINAATSVDAINALVANFEADLDDYIAKKDAIVAKFGDAALVEKIGKLVPQYRKDIDTAEANAKANVEAASTLAEAENYYLQFVIAVDNKLAEQKLIEDKDNGGNGQIQDKIKLLEVLEDYLEKVKFFEGLVNAAYAKDENGNLTGEAWALYDKVEDAQAFYDKVMFAEKPTADDEDPFWSYKAIKQEIDYMEKYITLAIDLSSIDLQAKIGNPLLTEVDTAVSEYLAKTKDGELISFTIRPTAYKADGTLDTENDATAKFLADVRGLLKNAEKKFGASGVKELKARYGTDGTNSYIDLLIAAIQAKYDALNRIRVDAETKDIVDLIDAAYAATYDLSGETPVLRNDFGVVGDDQDKKVQAAWKAIKEWNDLHSDTFNKKYDVFTMTGAGNVDIWATYDKEFAGVVYKAAGFDATNQKFNNITDTWTADKVEKDYVTTCFIPNIDLLIEASQARYAAQVQNAIMNSKLDEANIFLSEDDDLDARYEIEYARYIYNNFLTVYVKGKAADGEDDYTIYNKYFLDADGKDNFKDRLVAAGEKCANLIALMDTANNAINGYKVGLGEGDITEIVKNIKWEDFQDGGKLYAAYDAYIDFAEANGATVKANQGNPAYTNVITNESVLIECMRYYNEVRAFARAKVESGVKIDTAYANRIENVMDNVPFCEAVQSFAKEMHNEILAFAYVDLPSYVEVNEEQVAITVANEKFYFVEILSYNTGIVDTAAKDVKTYIEDVNHGLEDFDLSNPDNNPLA